MPILTVLFILFISVPLIEIFLFIQVGSVIGAWNTIAVVFITAILGALLLRQQGLHTLARGRDAMSQNRLPARELLEGMILVFTGALLLTPGFFTDAIGFLCLVPGVRGVIVNHMIRHFTIVGATQTTRAGTQGRTRDADQNTIEGEFWDENDR